MCLVNLLGYEHFLPQTEQTCLDAFSRVACAAGACAGIGSARVIAIGSSGLCDGGIEAGLLSSVGAVARFSGAASSSTQDCPGLQNANRGRNTFSSLSLSMAYKGVVAIMIARSEKPRNFGIKSKDTGAPLFIFIRLPQEHGFDV